MPDPTAIVESTKTTLSKKVGPAPVWAWAAIGLGAFWVITKNRRKTAVSSAASGETVAAPDSWMPSTAMMPQGYIPSTDETTADEFVIYDNDDWVKAASRKMTSSHAGANTTVLSRLRSFISGGQFSQEEYDSIVAIAEEAITLVGPPPYPVGPLMVRGTAPAPMPPMGNPNPTPNGVDIPLQPKPDAHFKLQDFGGSIESAADYYYGDSTAWNRFRVYDPAGDPNTGWINQDSYMQLATGVLPPDITLVANGGSGRIR